MPLSTYLANALRDHVAGASSDDYSPYTAPQNIYYSLLNAATAGAFTEVSGTTYARSSGLFAVTAGKLISQGVETWTVHDLDNWQTITHLGVHDASSGGNYLWYIPMSPNIAAPASGDILSLGAYGLQLDFE